MKRVSCESINLERGYVPLSKPGRYPRNRFSVLIIYKPPHPHTRTHTGHSTTVCGLHPPLSHYRLKHPALHGSRRRHPWPSCDENSRIRFSNTRAIGSAFLFFETGRLTAREGARPGPWAWACTSAHVSPAKKNKKKPDDKVVDAHGGGGGREGVMSLSLSGLCHKTHGLELFLCASVLGRVAREFVDLNERVSRGRLGEFPARYYSWT